MVKDDGRFGKRRGERRDEVGVVVVVFAFLCFFAGVVVHGGQEVAELGRDPGGARGVPAGVGGAEAGEGAEERLEVPPAAPSQLGALLEEGQGLGDGGDRPRGDRDLERLGARVVVVGRRRRRSFCIIVIAAATAAADGAAFALLLRLVALQRRGEVPCGLGGSCNVW